MTAALDLWRADTPGVSQAIHLNNAGSSLMPKSVIQAIQDHIKLESLIGGYEAEAMKWEEIATFYSLAAKLINAKPRNVAFTSNATDSFSKALSSIPFKKGDVIITSTNDYVSNQLSFLSLCHRFNVKLIRVKNSPGGSVDLDDLYRKVKSENPKVVSISHIPTNSGLVQPVEQVGEICKENQTLFILDACQSAGQIDLNVEVLNCDFLSATFRKFLRGPRGSGFLYVADRILQQNWYPLFLDMRGASWIDENEFMLESSARRFEDWENPYALLLGAKEAIDYALSIGMDLISDRIRYLSGLLREKLISLPNIRILDGIPSNSGIVSYHPGSPDSTTHSNLLSKNGVHHSVSHKTSALLDFTEKGVEYGIRLSPHYFNSETEIQETARRIHRIQKRLT